ncbi:MAG: 5-formyltetrahydrofolate cyclo-ligase [Gemmatimonadota bacterium]
MLVEQRKASLRLTERSRLRAAPDPAADRAARSLSVQERFLSAFPPLPGRRVALYAAMRGEVGTDLIRSRCLAAGVHLYYPRVMDDGELSFFRHREGDGWVPGRFGIREPRAVSGDEGVRAGFDVVVVPGLAFDARGRRLGQGYGCYDRFLAALDGSAVTVGLAFSWQLVPEVPVEAWDVPVDAVVTEDGIVRAAAAGGA